MSRPTVSRRFFDSPPRGRGRRGNSHRQGRRHRLTPAWAGKTAEAVPHQNARSTHPRVGGEDLRWPGTATKRTDSPPRGRGRRLRHQRSRRPDRLTPAWAGKTPWALPWAVALSTHPRVGGEDSIDKDELREHLDSPPRGRGRRELRGTNGVLVRLTPAWAGKTLGHRRSPWLASTHPRVGGEDANGIAAYCATIDSPPRGRGRRCPPTR